VLLQQGQEAVLPSGCRHFLQLLPLHVSQSRLHPMIRSIDWKITWLVKNLALLRAHVTSECRLHNDTRHTSEASPQTNEAWGIAQYSPPLRGGVDAPLRRSSRSDMVRPGWSVRRKRGRAGLTTPSAPLRWLRCFLLLAQPPLLAEEGNIALPGVFRKPESFT